MDAGMCFCRSSAINVSKLWTPKVKKTKLLVAILAAGGLVSAHAESSVTLYGIADASLQYINNVAVAQSTGSAGSPVRYQNQSKFAMYSGGYSGSRWGLRGVEDLGGGNSAFFTLENGFSIATGAFSTSGVEFSRQAFVGFKNDRYGSVSFGRQYEAITDLVQSYGPIAYGNFSGTYAGDISNYDNYARINNSVKYRSPEIAGLSGELLYAFGGVAGAMSQDSTISAGLKYTTGPWGIAVAYLRMDNSNSTANTWNGTGAGNFNSSVTAGFAGAKRVQIVDAATRYELGPVSLGLSYGYTHYNPSSVSLLRRAISFQSAGANALWHYSPSVALGAGYSYTLGQSVNGTASRPHYQQVTLTSSYSLSRTTMLYATAAYQHASGSTLDAYGNVVNATASVGDSANGSSSASASQVLVRAGIRKLF